jgi:formiminoglutamase
VGGIARTLIDPCTCLKVVRTGHPVLGEHVQSLSEFSQCRKGDIVIIGIPDDRGVAINQGRVGAADGPTAFREALYRLVVSEGLDRQPMWDAGNIALADTNHATHEQLADVVAQVVRREAVPMVIGGGHDNTYGGIKGVVAGGQSPGLINIDPHLDVRPPEADGSFGSGTPFRRLIDDQILSGPQIVEFGCQTECNSPDHMGYTKNAGVRLWTLRELRAGDSRETFLQLLQDLSRTHASVAVTFDLDAIVSSAAPGVSAPATFGFSAEEALAFMQLVGQQPTLCYLDLMELNPVHDVDGRTAKLAAAIVWHMLLERNTGGL